MSWVNSRVKCSELNRTKRLRSQYRSLEYWRGREQGDSAQAQAHDEVYLQYHCSIRCQAP